jgi:Uma2 family endonuclease
MTTKGTLTPNKEIEYPESDGQPMADNTKQYKWIATIKWGLDRIFAQNSNVFVAGDLLWYAVEGNVKARQAPDAMVIFGRPKGDRGSYKQWEEGNIPPQVVFEVWSPGNDQREMDRKRGFYEQHGVQEYYEYDPDRGKLYGWLRTGNHLAKIQNMQGFVSPLLDVTFGLNGDDLELFAPQGWLFKDPLETRLQNEQEIQQERQRADQAQAHLDTVEALLEQERREKEQERLIKEKALAKLKELGLSIDEL